MSESTFIEVKASQFQNASSPIEVTPLPIVTEVKASHEQNASSPIEVTLLGMVIEVKPSHSLNASSPIEVTLLGMVYDPSFSLGYIINSVFSLLNNTPFNDV